MAEFLIHQATAAGSAGGISIIELYGAGARQALQACFEPRSGRMPAEGEVRLGVLADAAGQPVDEVLVGSVDAEVSWSGLPCWTVSCHGGIAVTARVLQAIADRGGSIVAAEKILDLAQRAGALDGIRRQATALLADAHTRRSARYFLRMSRGELNARIEKLAAEAASGRLAPDAAREMVDGWIRDSGPAVRLGKPLRLLLAGEANAGKSTLFNALLGRERVIVSPVPGTTRDLIEEMIEVEGYPVILIDSAGLRPGGSPDPVERQGMLLARHAACDAILLLKEGDGPLAAFEREPIERMPAAAVLVVRTKRDLFPAPPAGKDAEAIGIAAIRGDGLADLRAGICRKWLGPPESAEIPALPFTDGLLDRFRSLGEMLGGWNPAQKPVDGLREVFIQWLAALGAE